MQSLPARGVPRVLVSLVTFVTLAYAPEAEAQSVETIGIRAQGMGGAFTAVADDATATWWNPAGLAGGSYFSTSSNTAIRRILTMERQGRLDRLSCPGPELLPLANQ